MVWGQESKGLYSQIFGTTWFLSFRKCGVSQDLPLPSPLSPSPLPYLSPPPPLPGFFQWLSGKESTCQGRRHGFSPWVGKIPWRRKWQPSQEFLPGKSHGQMSLVGQYIGSLRVGEDLATKQCPPATCPALPPLPLFFLPFLPPPPLSYHGKNRKNLGPQFVSLLGRLWASISPAIH